MAEVIIVSTVILGTLVGLYTIFNKMYIVYTERSYYYNVDAVYAGESIYKYLVSSDKFVDVLKNIKKQDSEPVASRNYKIIEELIIPTIIKENSEKKYTITQVDKSTD